MVGQSAASQVPFVFSVDVEDPDSSSDGQGAVSRVAQMTERYLAFLAAHNATGTFFVVGKLALAMPGLIARIADCGHELASHSYCHMPLEHMSERVFRDDLSRSIDALARAGQAAGAGKIDGYRAPMFSLTARTAWAHRILGELGITYSSSVLAAPNPLYSWSGFGSSPRIVEGVLELPVSLMLPPVLPLPAGGVYWRALPRPLINLALARHHRAGRAVRSYLHPYDIDDMPGAASNFAHARGPFYRWLLERNRSDVFARLEAAAELGFRFTTYREHGLAVRRALGQRIAGGPLLSLRTDAARSA